MSQSSTEFFNDTTDGHFINNSFIKLLLEASKEHLTPSLYSRCLKEAGLERYLQTLPPPNTQNGASFKEINTFILNIYTSTHESIFNLFSQNLGKGIARGITTLPHWMEIRPKVEAVFADAALNSDEKLNYLVEAMNSLQTSSLIVQVEGLNLLVTAKNCVFCHGVTTSKPLCHARKIYLTTALKWLTNWTFSVEQTQSLVFGDPVCAYSFTSVSAG